MDIKTKSLLFFIVWANLCFAQERSIKKDSVNQSIINYLKDKYPSAKKMKFFELKNNDSTFVEVDFKTNNQKQSATFTKNGTLVEEEQEVCLEQINISTQTNIKKYLTEKYQKFKLIKCQIVNPNSKNSLYEIEIKKSQTFIEVYFNSIGEFIKLEELEFKPINTLF